MLERSSFHAMAFSWFVATTRFLKALGRPNGLVVRLASDHVSTPIDSCSGLASDPCANGYPGRSPVSALLVPNPVCWCVGRSAAQATDADHRGCGSRRTGGDHSTPGVAGGAAYGIPLWD